MSAAIAQLDAGGGSLVLETASQASMPLWRHCGLAVVAGTLPDLAQTRAPASFSLDRDCPLGTAPVAGEGWFGPEFVQVRREGAPLGLRWTGKRVEQRADAITVELTDAQAALTLTQHFRAEPGGWSMAASLRNDGTDPLALDWLASALVPLPQSITRLVSARGRHNAELVEVEEPLPSSIWLREGRRGISGHGGAPLVLGLSASADWHRGEAIGLQLVWSGDSRLAVERDDEGFAVLSAGVALRPGEVVLGPGESWQAPEALLVIGDEGRNAIMAGFHTMVRARVTWPGGAMAPRKVHLNSWEARYFDHDEEAMIDLARSAAQLGVERFVLDDGWFAGRRDDHAGLGDWWADPAIYPEGLRPMAERIRALGLEFGLWVEPEMVNPNSDLFRAHPDWALGGSEAPLLTARNQLVLDMARAEVRDALFVALDRLLREVPIGYLKWDHNRDLAPRGGAAQVRGTGELLARLRMAHPGVEIESCAGGGGRSDLGMVPFVHRFWTSDNIDALSRMPIQRGFLGALPPEMMGCHVGASPAHATGRRQPLAFRAAVAMPGHFGIELDPRRLDAQERAELAEWIGFNRQWRDLLHGGQVWLGEGPDGLLWQVQGSRDEFLLFVIRTAPPLDRRPQPLCLPFLRGRSEVALQLLRIAGGEGGHAAPRPALFEAMREVPQVFSGSWLAHAGLPLPPMRAENVAIFHGRAP